MESDALPRRVPWGKRGTPPDPRAHLVAAASRCLAEVGLERTSITVIARAAGVSRQTVYKYFASREEIIEQALEREASEASRRLMAAARQNTTAAGFVVDLCLSALEEFSRNPAISPMISMLDNPGARERVMTPEMMAVAREILEPIATYRPDRAEHLDEMTETYLRFVLSLLTIRGPSGRTREDLRGYLRRVLVPAMGLSEAPETAR